MELPMDGQADTLMHLEKRMKSNVSVLAHHT